MKKLSLFCVMGLCFANFAFSEELEFDSLEISGSKIKNDEKTLCNSRSNKHKR